MGARPRNFYDFAGEKLTIREISVRTGIDAPTLVCRVHAGVPLDAPYGARPRYTLDGVTLTCREWAERWNISTKNAWQRIDYYRRRNRSENTLLKRTWARYEIDGRIQNRYEWARQWNVTTKTASSRISFYLQTGRAKRTPDAPDPPNA